MYTKVRKYRCTLAERLLLCAGIGWTLWRSKDYLPEDLIFHINYLGSDQATITLNFSR